MVGAPWRLAPPEGNTVTRQEPGHAKSPMPWILDLGFSESTVGLLLEVRLVGKQKERCHENSATAARPGRPVSHAQIRVQQAVPFPWSCRPPSGFPTPQDLPPVSGSQRWWPLLWVPQTPVAVAGVWGRSIHSADGWHRDLHLARVPSSPAAPAPCVHG